MTAQISAHKRACVHDWSSSWLVAQQPEAIRLGVTSVNSLLSHAPPFSTVRTSLQQSGSPSAAHSRRRNWILVPVCSGRRRTSAQNIAATRLPSVLTSGSPSFATMTVRPRSPGWPKPKARKETLCKTEVSCDPLVCAVPMFGNLDGERQELMASGNIEGW